MENVESQLQSVVLNDGTRLQRLGPQRWVANPDHPRATEWIGDIIRDENQTLK